MLPKARKSGGGGGRTHRKAELAQLQLPPPASAPTRYDRWNGDNANKTRPQRAVGGLWHLAVTNGRMKLTRLCHAQVHVDTFRARTVKAAATLQLGAEGTRSAAASLPTERAAAKMEGRSGHSGSDSQANEV